MDSTTPETRATGLSSPPGDPATAINAETVDPRRIVCGARQAGRSDRLRREAEAAGGRIVERDPRPGDADFGCGPRYHRLDTADFAGGLWAPPKRERDVLAEAAWNGMGA